MSTPITMEIVVIPALIAPAYNRHDLLLRALRSIDHEVERGLVVDGGRNIEQSPEYPDLLDQMERLNLYPFTPPFASMGYGGAINFGILQTFDVPWWMWVSNDVQFKPGFLDGVVERMDSATGARVITGGFTWGAMNRAAFNAIGLVDEFSFFPIYYDDNDYAYRAKLAGVEWLEHGTEDGILHGDHEFGASLTIKSDSVASSGNNRTFGANRSQYVNKWGGTPGEERFDTPWNSGLPLWAVRPDIDTRRERQW